MLFADLVGFTTLAERLDPEHVKNLVDSCFERLVADVHSYGGRVDKILGDAIVALFGAPVAHEDDAERAVRAALRMQETLRQQAGELGDVKVEMRVGVNTGEVLVGALRAGGDYTAMGDVVNVASRLQTAAAPGQVLVGAETHAATRSVIRYEPLGLVEVRGRGQVDAWHAVDTIAPPGYRPGRRRTELIGRAEEMGVLRHALATARQRRRAEIVLLSGDPGVGKTRMAEELADLAQNRYGATVFEGRCVPYGEANVWWPLAAAIRQACQIETGDSVEEVAAKCRTAATTVTSDAFDDAELSRLTDGMLFLLGLPGALSEIDPTRAREDALRAMHTVLANVAAHSPVVLVLTELHWADHLLLEFLDGLTGRLRNVPFVLVATARPELADRWRPDVWRNNVVTLHLEPLDPDAAGQLLDVLTGDEMPLGLRETLLERAGGNPLFLEELAAIVKEAGTVTDVPASLRALVATRLDGLPPTDRKVLDAAAVVGRVGSVEALRGLMGRLDDTVDVDEVLTELVARDLVGLEDGRWAFRSELVREVAYETLTKAERARRHAGLAQCLAERPDQPGDHAEQLAHHYGVAADLALELGPLADLPTDLVARALDALDRAITAAEQRETAAPAARLLDQALRLVPPDDGATRRQLMVRRARARAASRELPAARSDATAVLKQAEAEDDEAGAAAALTVLGDIQRMEGSLYDSAATLRQAVEKWRVLDDPSRVADALRLLGMTELFMGELDTAEADISEALRIFKTLREGRGEAWAMQNLAWIALTGGDLPEADRRIQESMRIFEDIGDWGGWGWAVGLLAWVRYFEGRLDEAEELVGIVLPEVREGGDRWPLGMLIGLVAGIRLWRGDAEEAARQATEAQQVFASIDDRTGQVRAMLPLVRALAATGRIDEAERTVEEVEALAPALPEPAMQHLGPVLAAGTAVYLGQGPRAHEAITRAQAGVGGSSVELEVLAGLSHLLLGQTDEALNALEGAWSAADGIGLRANAGSALALARAVAAMPDEAEAVLAELAGGEGTYLDRQIAAWARGFVLLQQGDLDRSGAVLADAVRAADATSDRVVQGLSRLALAHARAAMSSPDAADAATAARDRLSALGIRDTDWDRVFAAATTSTSSNLRQ